MQYITGFEHYQEEAGTAVTLGKFDGLHRGHRKLVERIMEHVEQEPDLKSVVCFFEMTEFKKMCHLDQKKLMMNEERAIRLDGRVDYLIECPFLSVKEMEAEVFIEKILSDLFHAKYIVVGENFRFGHERRGDVGMLAKYQETYGYRLEVIPNEYYGERIVSSTYVKEVMKTGDIDLVNRLLSYPYTIAERAWDAGSDIRRWISSRVRKKSCLLPEPTSVSWRWTDNGIRVCATSERSLLYQAGKIPFFRFISSAMRRRKKQTESRSYCSFIII